MANPINALYRVIAKGLTGAKAPLASDVNQLVDLFSGNMDAGELNFAAPLAAMSTTGITIATASGTALGVGTYMYKFTYITGNLQSDNSTSVFGETAGSASVSVTITTGNQNVTISGLPAVANWPATAIGIRIYRTAVGGADGTQKLVATLYTNYARSGAPSTTYTDTLADGSLGVAVPTANSTGTKLGANNQSVFQVQAIIAETDTRTVTITRTNGVVTQVTESDGGTTVRTTNITRTNSVVSSISQTVGPRTTTYTINRNSSGSVSSISKTVV